MTAPKTAPIWDCAWYRLLTDVAYYSRTTDTYLRPTRSCPTTPWWYARVRLTDGGSGATYHLCRGHDTAARELDGYMGSIPLAEQPDVLTGADLRRVIREATGGGEVR